jgi:putative addiction module component (TIGR02574 family)
MRLAEMNIRSHTRSLGGACQNAYTRRMIDTATLDRLLAMSVDERLVIAERLWESLIADAKSVPIPDWHRDLVDDRLVEDDADPNAVESWKDLKARIETSS